MWIWLKNMFRCLISTDRLCSCPDILYHFDSDRVQVIGYVEYTYLQTLEEAKKMKMYDELLSHKIPCLIFSRALEPDQELLEKATQADTPVLITQKSTSSFMAELIRWMNVKLAPCISIHGVRVDVYGVGVLIMGESGSR